MKEKLDYLLRTEKKLIIAGTFAFILLATILISFFSPTKKPPTTPRPITSSQKQLTALLMPKLTVKRYINKAILPNLPTTLTTYTFKFAFSEQDITNFAAKVGAKQITTSKNYLTFTNTQDKEKFSYGYFNKQTGEFSMQYFGVVKPVSFQSNQLPQTEALTYLQQLGVADATVSCPITYNRLDQPTLTFVECHRDWQKLGLPDYDLAGILNIPQTNPLNSAVLGAVDENSPKDSTITNVRRNDGLPLGVNGVNAEQKVRPTTFNSATVAITPDGRIIQVSSNLKWLTSESSYPTSQVITSPKEGLKKLLNNTTQLIYTPAGDGTIDFAQFYNSQGTNAKEATITDMQIVYLEKSDNAQRMLIPMYIARGYTELNNGYRALFVKAIPAIKSEFASLSTQQVAGAATKNEQLQIGNFIPNQVPTILPSLTQTSPTEIPIEPTNPSPTPTPQQNQDCTTQEANKFAGTTTTLMIPEYGSITVKYSTQLSDEFQTHMYIYVPASNGPSLDSIRKWFLQATKDQFLINTSYWYNKQNSLVMIQSSNDALQFFDSIYEQKDRKSGRIITNDVNNGPPIPPALYQTPQYRYINVFLLNEVANDVAAKTVELYKNGTLATYYQNHPNIFPDITVQRRFSNVLWNYYQDPRITLNNNCYISGGSPSIFLYPPQKEFVTIALPKTITYTDPQTIKAPWKVVASPSGQISNVATNTTLSHLYYEYNKRKISISEPKNGIITTKKTLQATIYSIASQLQLTQTETNQLVNEIQNALTNQPTSTYYKLSLVMKSELDTKLPVIISPIPDHFYRINVAITPLVNEDKILAPNLQPMDRSGFTAIEIGATYQ